MKLRFLVLAFLLSVVTCATVWRVWNPRAKVAVSLESLNVRPAPEFQLLDQNSRPIQLKGYVGRYRVLLCFFDAAAGPNADPVLQRLKEVYPTLKKSGIMVFAVSSPLGPDQKAQTLSYAFPILRDTLAGQPESCCTVWGRTKSTAEATFPVRISPATFLIEANGMVSWETDFPKPAEDPLVLINALVSGQR